MHKWFALHTVVCVSSVACHFICGDTACATFCCGAMLLFCCMYKFTQRHTYTHKHTLELVCTCIGLFVISCLSLKSKLICRVCARRSFGLRLAHCPLCAPGLFYALTSCFVVALHALIVCVNFVDNL